MMEADSIHQTECFDAGVQFARTEGIVPAPEPTHALAGTVREALEAKEAGEETGDPHRALRPRSSGHGRV